MSDRQRSRCVTLSQLQAAPASNGNTGGRSRPDAPSRVVIESVWPEIGAGRHPAKRAVGETVDVSADIFADGHDQLGAAIRYRAADDAAWHEIPMIRTENDRWIGSFLVTRLVDYIYTVQGWVDPFASWRGEVIKKRDAGQDIGVDLREGLQLVMHAVGHPENLSDDCGVEGETDDPQVASTGAPGRSGYATRHRPRCWHLPERMGRASNWPSICNGRRACSWADAPGMPRRPAWESASTAILPSASIRTVPMPGPRKR